MPDHTPSAGRSFYRRVAPQQWQGKPHGLPQPVLFHVRPAEKNRISFFNASLVTPHDVIQALLNGWESDLASGDTNRSKKADINLRKYGSTVKEAVDKGWGVVEVRENILAEYGLVPLDNLHRQTGHVSITGNPDDFQRHSIDLVERCRTILAAEIY